MAGGGMQPGCGALDLRAVLGRRQGLVLARLGSCRGPQHKTARDVSTPHMVIESVRTKGMAFRDPRRFGGVTAYETEADLAAAWDHLGPDGLTVSTQELETRLQGSNRPIKAALLDQTVVAGVGNIYADESLHAAGIHPLHRSSRIDPSRLNRLAIEIRRILNQAADAGGSTLRDYRDAFGQPGDAVQLHAVYGRADEPCERCQTILRGIRLQGRATVFCPRCQHLTTKSMSPRRPAGRGERASQSRPR